MLPESLTIGLRSRWSSFEALVCADWLEEHGESDRAIKIRSILDVSYPLTVAEIVSECGLRFDETYLRLYLGYYGGIYFVGGTRHHDGIWYTVVRYCPVLRDHFVMVALESLDEAIDAALDMAFPSSTDDHIVPLAII